MKKETNTQFFQVDIPEGITSFLEKKSGVFKNNKTPSYGVNQIVRCLRKSYYEKTKKKRKSSKSLDNLWPTVRGDLLHQMTTAYNWNELDMDFQIPLGDGSVGTVSGRLDMYDWKTKTIIDLKTTKFVRWQIKQGFLPKLEHILQLQCYDTMFSQYMPVENLNIVYADMTDIVTYKVQKRDLTDWIKTRISEIENSKESKKIPKGEISGLCKFCKYQTQCFEEGNGLTEKPLSIPKSNESQTQGERK